MVDDIAIADRVDRVAIAAAIGISATAAFGISVLATLTNTTDGAE